MTKSSVTLLDNKLLAFWLLETLAWLVGSADNFYARVFKLRQKLFENWRLWRRGARGVSWRPQL